MDELELINKLIENPYSILQKDKEKILLQIFREQLKRAMQINTNIRSFYESNNFDPEKLNALEEIPPLPVSTFKTLDLVTTKNPIYSVIKSSGTTTGIPSKISLDKVTSFRQSKSLVSILKDYIGKKRIPMLVIDTEKIIKQGNSMTARAAAVRGLLNFASEATFIMDGDLDNIEINLERLKEFHRKHSRDYVIFFGFTYIIWSKLAGPLKNAKLSLEFPNMRMIHTGGWKKLTSEQVTKEAFSKDIANLFGSNQRYVMDMYGMSEQVGIVFIDCEEGNKHAASCSDIIIRNPFTFKESKLLKEGLIEVLSVLPNSYPGQAILTEDIGEILGVDNCPCGRKGKYFALKGRAEKAEARGCGDTFTESIK